MWLTSKATVEVTPLLVGINPINMSTTTTMLSPFRVHKDRMSPQDMCRVTSSSSRIYLHKPARLSACSPFFMKAKCCKYLFDVAINSNQIGLGWTAATYVSIRSFIGAPSTEESKSVCTKAGTYEVNSMEPLHRCIVLDIEGTTTPISFVTDVLFPYAHDNVGRHLSLTYDSPETQDDIKLLRLQVEEDLKAGLEGAVLIPSAEEGKDKVISALVANVEAMIKADRKITALKELQGHIWRTGFKRSELEAIVFEDVPKALERWHASGIKVYIYSSGSRLAQRLIFGNTSSGDLRKYLCGFFDTKVGNKRETQSYVEISESVGVDYPSELLFITDVYQEAIAAKAAGLEVIISVRPGNGPLPDNHGFKTVTSFAQI